VITASYVRTMAAYNAAANRVLYDAAKRLPDAERRRDRGAFFGSLHGTLSHILWGDSRWMALFDNWPEPATPIAQSGRHVEDFTELCARRDEADAAISRWARRVDDAWLDGNTTWFSKAAGREVTASKRFLVAHFFNHQTHHRGQAHALLTAAGERPGDIDLFLLVPDVIL
jgi:uncharacterized damage-inducible protein DinB